MPTKPITILIADDHPDGRNLIESLLIGSGYKLIHAEDGEEALVMAKQHEPDLILLDVMMPKKSGFEVCRELRAMPILADVPILMVTALNTQRDILQALKAGADDFIAKPYNMVELRARIQTILRLNRYRRLTGERARFEWVVDNVEDGYLVLDMEENIQYANRQARQMLGLTENVTLPNFHQFVKSKFQLEPSEDWFDWARMRMAHKTDRRFLVGMDPLTKTMIWIQVTVLDPNKNIDRQWLLRLQNVSDQMAVQRDIWSFHKMVSHKLRTPLISMFNGMEILSMYSKKLSSDEVKELADNALSGVKRLQTEIEDILRYLEAPSLVKQDAPFRVRMLSTLTAQIGARLKLENVSVYSQHTIPDVSLTLTQRAMEWVLEELLENAIKFHPQNKPNVTVVLSRSSAHVLTLKFADDGRTLTREQLDFAWTPYFQGEERFTGQIAGMGLGLPMIASLVWEAGGTCRIKNREGQLGVLVELNLPILRNKKPPREKVAG